MLKSMTGFGRYEIANEERRVVVEMKAVNHRYCEISIKMPKKLSFFEAGIRNVLKKYISRGKVDVFITYEDYTEGKACVRYNSELAKEYLGDIVKAVDLAGAEALFPTENFRELFELAQELNIPYTIHAGEAAGSESIYAALSMGTKRLGHGVHSHKDEVLMEKLAEDNILLELCPTSNLHTCIFPDISQYPIRTFLENGVKFSINTDNMAVSATNLSKEWELIAKTFELSDEQMKEIALNTANATFADTATKEKLIAHIESI